jgi:hypothetical protein
MRVRTVRLIERADGSVDSVPEGPASYRVVNAHCAVPASLAALVRQGPVVLPLRGSFHVPIASPPSPTLAAAAAAAAVANDASAAAAAGSAASAAATPCLRCGQCGKERRSAASLLRHARLHAQSAATRRQQRRRRAAAGEARVRVKLETETKVKQEP